MIYYEPNEANPQSKLPTDVLQAGKPFPGLEEITGADFIVLPEKEKSDYEKVQELKDDGKNLMQISKQMDMELPDIIELSEGDPKTVLHEWLIAGALLVQRKSGRDFLASLGERLNHSVAKMREVAWRQYQCIVLVTGKFEKSSQFVVLNGKKTQWKWHSYIGAMESIKYKGAIIETVLSDNDIKDWIERQQQRMLSYKRQDVKWIVPTVYYPPDLPDTDDPLQLMRPVTDARLALVQIPGWGTEKVNALQEHVQKSLRLQYASPSLFQLLSYATSPETAKHISGIGPKLIQNARNYVGLQESEHLATSNSNITIQAN